MNPIWNLKANFLVVIVLSKLDLFCLGVILYFYFVWTINY